MCGTELTILMLGRNCRPTKIPPTGLPVSLKLIPREKIRTDAQVDVNIIVDLEQRSGEEEEFPWDWWNKRR
jgi:hypothetical protein